MASFEVRARTQEKSIIDFYDLLEEVFSQHADETRTTRQVRSRAFGSMSYGIKEEALFVDSGNADIQVTRRTVTTSILGRKLKPSTEVTISKMSSLEPRELGGRFEYYKIGPYSLETQTVPMTGSGYLPPIKEYHVGDGNFEACHYLAAKILEDIPSNSEAVA